MRTTLNLKENLVRQLMSITRAKTKTDAINQAMSDLIRRKKLEELKALSGKIHIDLDHKTIEKVNVRHQRRLAERRHDRR